MKDIDCGTLDDVANGRIVYTNDTTHLLSEATYTCNEHYQLEGRPTRTCSEDGKWSGIAASCREIRCPLPERPDGSILSISSMDRFRAVTLLRWSDRDVSTTSFRIGSNAIYKCERGFLLIGNNARSCDGSGKWTGPVPSCSCKSSFSLFEWAESLFRQIAITGWLSLILSCTQSVE